MDDGINMSDHNIKLYTNLISGTKTWKKDGTETSLKCNGTHTLTCKHTFTPEYDSDGDYKCKGYNEVRTVQKEIESPSVRLTTGKRMRCTVHHTIHFTVYIVRCTLYIHSGVRCTLYIHTIHCTYYITCFWNMMIPFNIFTK